MNEEGKYNDDFLRDLISRTPGKEPSSDFVEKVMGRIHEEPVLATEKKPFYLFLRYAWPYAAIIVTVLVVLMTSDFSFTQFIPGKNLIHDSVGPIFRNLIASFAGIFKTLKPSSLMLTVVLGGGALVLLDRVLVRKPKTPKTFVI